MVFEDIEDELEMSDVPPSFSDLFLCVKENFDGAFTSRGEVDSGQIGNTSSYCPCPMRVIGRAKKGIIEGSNVTMHG